MKEQINPSFSNKIFVAEEPRIETRDAYILTSEKELSIEYEFEPYVSDDYISVSTKVVYLEKVINGETKTPLIIVKVRYLIVKDHDLTAAELYPIVTHSTNLLIQRHREAPPAQLKNLPPPDCPQLSEVHAQLEELAHKLNL